MEKLLLVIDMQNDFIDGALGTPEALKIVKNVDKKIRAYEEAGDVVIFTADTHTTDYLQTQEGKHLPVPHCIQGTDGWNISPCLHRPKQALVLEKNSFGSKDLGIMLMELERKKQAPEQIELIGLCTDICIITNALIAKTFLPESRVIVDSSCCAGVTPESHANALEAMKMCQIEII